MLHNILQYGFPALGIVFAIAGYMLRTRRNSLWIAASTMILAGVSEHYDAFWPMAVFVLLTIWSLITASKLLDFAWRFKVGMVVVVALFMLLSFWPTASVMSGNKLPCPKYVQDHVSFRLVAGLDLRGGLRLVYTVDVEEAIRDRRDRYYDEMREMLARSFGFHEGDKPPTREAFAKLRKKVELKKPRGSSNQILIIFKDPKDTSKLDAKFGKHFRADMSMVRESDGKTFIFKIRTEVETRIRDRAVGQAKETISRRIDEMGLREASVVVRDEDIIIEVPGQDESTFKEIRDIISRTARLEFKMLDDDTDYIGNATSKIKAVDVPEDITLDNFEDAPVGPGKKNPIHYATIDKQPNETMTDALKRFKKWMVQFPVPDDHEVGFGKIYETDPDTYKQTERGWRTYYLFSRAEVTGDQISDAAAMPDQNSSFGGWHVALTFTNAGGERFEEITGANIKRRFAIILDGKVASAPVIQTKIGGGHAQITMGSSDPQTQMEDSRKLELVLRSGALPAPIMPSNEQRIGPSLGHDSINQGVKAAGIGAILVLLFMVIYYNKAGFIADLAVVFNLLIQMAVLAAFGASMTLPGIAGLALTMGMAVDANVLINERIREELRAGKSPRIAVESGYGKAFSAIIDGNLTTLLSGLILAQYGTGPIKGFAVTLMVGLVANLFTAVFATRVIFDYIVRAKRVKTLSIG